MSKNALKNTSKTNWERLDALTDDGIDTSDAPALTEGFFRQAQWRLPGSSHQSSQPVTIEITIAPEIFAWFESQGANYEQRIQDALRLYVEENQVVN